MHVMLPCSRAAAYCHARAAGVCVCGGGHAGAAMQRPTRRWLSDAALLISLRSFSTSACTTPHRMHKKGHGPGQARRTTTTTTKQTLPLSPCCPALNHLHTAGMVTIASQPREHGARN